MGLRKGWKIMPDDGEIINNTALKTVVSIIKDMEYQVCTNIVPLLSSLLFRAVRCLIGSQLRFPRLIAKGVLSYLNLITFYPVIQGILFVI